MIKKEVWLLLGTVGLTVILALGMIRWLAPGLLGGATDLQLVQLDEKLPAFYDGVFRPEHFKNDQFQLKDPLTRIRNHPFLPRMVRLGPHDILGFRNLAVPVVADVVTIGDSLTYGNNAEFEQNWPAQMADALGRKPAAVYNMSTGGWSAVQYLDMFSKSTIFRPRVVVVAYYTGNDPLESFTMAYGVDHWHWLRPDSSLRGADSPRVVSPAPESEWWPVAFSDGTRAIFTPTLRLASNQDHPAVKAGYAIMAGSAKHIAGLAGKAGIDVIFTIIPTKELVFAAKVAEEGLDVPADYATLVSRERENIATLSAHIQSLPGVHYVDVLTPLQSAAMEGRFLYAPDKDGHPFPEGYGVIGRAIADKVNALLPDRPSGLYSLVTDDQYSFLLVNAEGVWNFNSTELIEANGWPPGEVRNITLRELVDLPHMGAISGVDAARFGPACCPADN